MEKNDKMNFMKTFILSFLTIIIAIVSFAQPPPDTSTRNPFGPKPSTRPIKLNGNISIQNTPALSSNDKSAANTNWVHDYVAANGTSGAIKQLRFKVTLDLDTLIQHDSLKLRTINVFRSSDLQSPNSYSFSQTTGKVVFKRPSLTAGEEVIIQYSIITDSVGSGGGAPYVPPAVLRDLNFQTVTTGLAASGTNPIQWQGPIYSPTYGNLGLADSSIALADTGYIVYQVISGSSDNCIMGFNSTHANERYSTTGPVYNLEYGAMILSNVLYVFDNHLDVASTGITISGNLYIAIFKDKVGGSMVYKLKTSTTGATGSWTDRFTFTPLTDVRLYPVINTPGGVNLSNPKCYNCH